MILNLIRSAAFILAIALLGGCGHPKPPQGPTAFPVHGKVIYRGQPARNFRVTLHPIKAWTGKLFTPAGMSDSNGEFHLGSYQLNDGAPAGKYVVTFAWPKRLKPIDDDGTMKEVDQLQGRYADPKKSTFRVTIKEGENELPPFSLQ